MKPYVFVIVFVLVFVQNAFAERLLSYEEMIQNVRHTTLQKVNQYSTQKDRDRIWKKLADKELGNIVELMIMHCFNEGNLTGSYMANKLIPMSMPVLNKAQQSCVRFTIQAMQP